MSRYAVAALESGRAASIRLDVIDAITTALGGYLSVRLLFQGEGLDRLRDRAHAELVERIIRILQDLGWEVATEVSFNHYGERGSIDVLAFHRASKTLLVVEVKTVVPDLGGMLATLDRKVRLAPEIAASRGWAPDVVGRLLVVPEDSTARRRVDLHQAIFRSAFPDRNVAINRWLKSPTGGLSGLLFLSSARGEGQRRTRGRADRW